MKSITKTILFSAFVAAFTLAGAGKSLAHYDHDDKGWYDEHHVRHDFVNHNGHRGYWDKDDHGAKIFINI